MAKFQLNLNHGMYKFQQPPKAGENRSQAETGTCVLGSRRNQKLSSLEISSSDGGKTLTGTVSYAGEGPTGFRAKNTSQNHYNVEEQKGGKWQLGGIWTIGLRPNQLVIKMSLVDRMMVGPHEAFWGHVTYADGKPLSGVVAQID